MRAAIKGAIKGANRLALAAMATGALLSCEGAQSTLTGSAPPSLPGAPGENSSVGAPDYGAAPSPPNPTNAPATLLQAAQAGLAVFGVPTPAELGPGFAVDLAPAPAPPVLPVRPRKRLDLDQLEASIKAATGGLTWTEETNGQTTQLFAALSRTLGVPDYAEQTEEDVDPGALFQKFLGDAARQICHTLAIKDRLLPPAERILFAHVDPDIDPAAQAEAVEQNLAGLILRFHGHAVAPGHDALEPWRWLLQSGYQLGAGTQAADPAALLPGDAAWWTLCVGLLTHPDFYSY